MAEMIKISVFGILGVLLAVQFRANKPEYATYIGIAIGVVIFSYLVSQFRAVLGALELMKQYISGSEEYLSVLLKVVSITYICEFGAGVCKDAGYGAVAEQIEVMGKLSVMFAGLPILLAVVEQLQSFAG